LCQSIDAELTHLELELRVEIEQFRGQAQNLASFKQAGLKWNQ
jgi:uncharacterized protein YicC (UPF0701 family)